MDVLLRLTTTKKKKWEPLGSLAQVIIEAFPKKRSHDKNAGHKTVIL